MIIRGFLESILFDFSKSVCEREENLVYQWVSKNYTNLYKFTQNYTKFIQMYKNVYKNFMKHGIRFEKNHGTGYMIRECCQ